MKYELDVSTFPCVSLGDAVVLVSFVPFGYLRTNTPLPSAAMPTDFTSVILERQQFEETVLVAAVLVMPCATKFCCFVNIAVIIAASRGEGEHGSGYHEDVYPEFLCFHFDICCYCFCLYKRREAENPAS